MRIFDTSLQDNKQSSSTSIISEKLKICSSSSSTSLRSASLLPQTMTSRPSRWSPKRLATPSTSMATSLSSTAYQGATRGQGSTSSSPLLDIGEQTQWRWRGDDIISWGRMCLHLVDRDAERKWTLMMMTMTQCMVGKRGRWGGVGTPVTTCVRWSVGWGKTLLR